MSGQDFFKKVTNPEDKDRLIQDFVHSHQDLYSKTPEHEIFVFRPFRLKTNSFVSQLAETSLVPRGLPFEAVHNFSLQGERYFFKGKLAEENHVYEIFFDGDLFQLQRRQSYRVRVPASFNGLVNVISHNGKNSKYRGKLVDLSIGGCAFELLEDASVQRDDRLTIEVWLKNEVVFEAQGIVRHMNRPRFNAMTAVQYGFEFHPPNQTALEQRIFTLTLDIHRELYGRLG